MKNQVFLLSDDDTFIETLEKVVTEFDGYQLTQANIDPSDSQQTYELFIVDLDHEDSADTYDNKILKYDVAVVLVASDENTVYRICVSFTSVLAETCIGL